MFLLESCRMWEKKPCVLCWRGPVSFVHSRISKYTSPSTHICLSSTKNFLFRFKFCKMNHHINRQRPESLSQSQRWQEEQKREWGRGERGETQLHFKDLIKSRPHPIFFWRGTKFPCAYGLHAPPPPHTVRASQEHCCDLSRSLLSSHKLSTRDRS